MKNSTLVKSEGFSLGLAELLKYKDLFFQLAYRDLKVRYAQTALGVIWVVFQPALNLVIFTFIFNKVVKVETGGIPYPVFALAGLCAWSYFSFLAWQSANSLIGNQNLIKKVYFPRLIIPLGKALVGFVDFGVYLLFLMVMMLWYGFLPGAEIIFLPLFILINILFGLAIGIWVSALTIKYRDFQNIIQFVVQIGVYVTPVYYPATIVPEKYQLLYHLNPMAGIIEGFRWSLTGIYPPPPIAYLGIAFTLILLFTGLVYFRKVERTMADLV